MKPMAKNELNADAQEAVKAILKQMPEGQNWGQKESRHAIYLIAKDFGLELTVDAEKKVNEIADFKAAIDLFVNPSACAQRLDAQPTTSPCYRKRIPQSAALEDYS